MRKTTAILILTVLLTLFVNISMVNAEILPPGKITSFNLENQVEQVKLVWQLPSDDGGSTITGVAVERGESISGPYTRLIDIDFATAPYTQWYEYNDTSVRAGVTYWYRIAARNSSTLNDGLGPWSEVVGAKRGNPWIKHDFGTINGLNLVFGSVETVPGTEILYAYAIESDYSGSSKLVKSTDAGITWNMVNSALPSGGGVITSDTMAVLDENTIILGTYIDSELDTYKSIDGGLTFTPRTVVDGRYLNMSIYSMTFHGTTGLAVGDKGMILRTTDAGETWNIVRRPTYDTPEYATLNAVTFADGNTAYAVGRNGTIIRSTDAGLTWVSVAPTDPSIIPLRTGSVEKVELDSIASADANTVVAVGKQGTVLRAVYDGSTWTRLEFPKTGSGYNWWAPVVQKVRFTDSQSGYMVFIHGIMKTEDAGATWFYAEQSGDDPAYTSDIVFTAMGKGVISSAQTANKIFVLGAQAPEIPVNLSAVPADRRVDLSWQKATGVGITGYRIERATDIAGPYTTLTTVTNGTQYRDSSVQNDITYYYNVYTVNPIGESAPAGVLATPSLSLANPPSQITNFYFNNTDGQVQMYWEKPADNGSNITAYVIERAESVSGPYTVLTQINLASMPYYWTEGYTDTTTQLGRTYWYRIAARNSALQNDGLGTWSEAIGARRGNPWVENNIAKINDQDVLFNSVKQAPGTDTLYALASFYTNYPYYYEGLKLLKSIDAGATWTVVNSSLPALGGVLKPEIMSVLDENTIILASYIDTDTEMNKSIDGGMTFTGRTVVDGETLYSSIHSVDFMGNLGLAVGDRGAVLRTTDAGETWNIVRRPASGTPEYVVLNKVTFADANTAYAVGRNGTIIKSIDGGQTWTSIAPLDTSIIPLKYNSTEKVELKDISSVSVNIAMAIGDQGVVIYTADGGATWRRIATSKIKVGMNWTTPFPQAVSFVDLLSGYIVFTHGILKTEDSGATWLYEQQPVTGIGYASSITLTASDRGIVTPLQSANKLFVKGSVDTTAPITTLQTSPSGSLDDWFGSIPWITLTASERGATYYKWNDALSYSTYTSAIQALVGENTLYYYSVDVYGNTEAVKQQVIKVDASVPSAPILVSPAHNAMIPSLRPVFTWNAATDVHSGIKKYILNIDGYVVKEVAGDVLSTQVDTDYGNGTHTWSVTAVDGVGFRTTSDARTFSIDTIAPTVQITSPADGTATARVLYIKGTALDNYFDRYTLHYRNSAGTTTLISQSTMLINNGNLGSWDTRTVPDGTYTIILTAYDRAGNTSTAQVTISVDNTAPVTTLTTDPASADGNAGWYRTLNKIYLSSNEPGGTVYGWTPSLGYGYISSFGITPRTGSNTLYYYSSDLLGNTEAPTKSQLIKYDPEQPYEFSLFYPANNHVTNVVRPEFNWQASYDYHSQLAKYMLIIDGNIAVNNIPAGVTSIQVPADLADGPHTWAVIAEDIAGNQRVSETRMLYIDTTSPTVEITQPQNNASVAGLLDIIGTANDSHFHSYKIQIRKVSDGAALIATDNITTWVTNGVLASINTTQLRDGSYYIDLSARDTLGHTAQVTITMIVANDTIAPATTTSITQTPSVHGWYGQDVSVGLPSEDNVGGSGVKETRYSYDRITWFNYTGTPVVISTEGVNRLYYYSIDNSGNVETEKYIDINLDKTAPAISGTTLVGPNANGWYNADVTVRFTGSDDISGIASITPDTTISTEGSGQSVTGTVTDKAGNTETFTVTGINIDKTAPDVWAIPLTDNDENMWYNTDVVIHFNGLDMLSGIASVTPDITISTEGESQMVSGEAFDLAGNRGVFDFYVNIDKTAPVISYSFSAEGTTFTVGQNVTLTWSANDALSGIATSGGFTSGHAIDTSTEGTKTIVLRAVDIAGNSVEVQATYTVAVQYQFSGVLAPIKADGSSLFKLGMTVPVKFQLKDTNGNSVTDAIAKIYLSKIDEGILGTELEAESTSAATDGNTFRYDSTDDQYVFNLGTKTLSKGTWCIRIWLNDNTNHFAYISLK